MRHAFALVATLAIAAPALAFTTVSSPDAAYRTATTLIGVPASPAARSHWGDIDLTVGFSTALLPLTVGFGWATWGSPPDTEQDNPRVWWTQGATTLTFTFSKGITAWGFEAQPNPFAVFDITADYYDSGWNLIGTITRSVDGNAGARLFAGIVGSGDGLIRYVTVRSDADFAVAQLRYQLPAIPEPATWAMLIAGFGLVGFAARRRRTIDLARATS